MMADASLTTPWCMLPTGCRTSRWTSPTPPHRARVGSTTKACSRSCECQSKLPPRWRRCLVPCLDATIAPAPAPAVKPHTSTLWRWRIDRMLLGLPVLGPVACTFWRLAHELYFAQAVASCAVQLCGVGVALRRMGLQCAVISHLGPSDCRLPTLLAWCTKLHKKPRPK